jgi:hypothetical protein
MNVKVEIVRAINLPVAERHELASPEGGRPNRELPAHTNRTGQLPALELGQELEAVVIEELGGGRVLLQIDDALVEAEGPENLETGQPVRLRVEQLQPRVLLQITGRGSTLAADAARLLRSELTAGQQAGELLDMLRYELAALPNVHSPEDAGSPKLAHLRAWIATTLDSSAPPSPEMIALWGRDGGLFYESKLFDQEAAHRESLTDLATRDFKGLLLGALEELKDNALSAGLKEALAAQLKNVERQQVANVLAQLEGGGLQLQIPIFTAAGFFTALLALQPDGRNSSNDAPSGERGYRLLFALDLEAFGATRIDAYVGGKELRAAFFVDRETSLEVIRRELPSFRDGLLALGYHSVQLTASRLADLAADKQAKFAALAAGTPASIRLLDVKI